MIFCLMMAGLLSACGEEVSDKQGRYFDSEGNEIEADKAEAMIVASKAQGDRFVQRARDHQTMVYNNALVKQRQNLPLSEAEEEALSRGGKSAYEADRQRQDRNQRLLRGMANGANGGTPARSNP
tara:strand:+ start:3228 stop:3602 length:375 start_codon:yes stop_codon:yes gene_type:complete